MKRVRNFIISCVLLVVTFVLADVGAQKIVLAEYKSEQINSTNSALAAIRVELESKLTKDFLLINSVASYIAINPDLTSDEFDRFAAEVISKDSTILNLAAAPDYKITYVYPLKNNETILGVDYRNLPKQWPEVELAVKTGEMVIAGPIKLLQGFEGLLGRAPVYVDTGDEKEFWGLVSSAINFEALMESVRAIADSRYIDFYIAKQDKHIYGNKDAFSNEKVLTAEVALPNAVWQIYAKPSNGWRVSTPVSVYVHLVMLIGLLTSVYFTYYKFRKDYFLAVSEKRFKDFTESSSDWVWEMNDKGLYTFTSDKVKDLLGYTPQEMIGKSLFSFMTEKEAERASDVTGELIKQRKPLVEIENWLLTKDGNEICIRTNGVPIYDAANNFTGYRGVDKNITDRIKVQNELAKNKELLDLFFSQSLDGFFFMMLDEPIDWNDSADKEKLLDYAFSHQRITKINSAMLTKYKATEDDFIGLTPADFFQHDIEAGRLIWRELFDNDRIHVDTTEKRFDGTEMIIEGDYICLHDTDGKITGHFGVQRDVTDFRNSEENLNRYVNIVDENVITSQTDTRGDITYASKAFCEISGYSKEELLGNNHNIIRHPDMPEELYEDLWLTITADDTWQGEIKNLKKDGSFYWVDTTISPLINRSGEKYGYAAIRQDITAKKELERISVTDRLTGVYNRMKLDSVIQTEHQRYTRYGELYSIILMDIDKFKSVNDTYGHLVGDYVLKELANIVPQYLRETDIFGRWGGEEFLIICPHTDIEGAYTIAEKVREGIESHDFEYVKKITSSFGAADIGQAKDYYALIKLVDNMLYEAKRTGRNKVCMPSVATDQDQ
ncbi:MAG: hypothetical protein C0602_10885 [Denitrovibrio sp.]|nr:MAG: hypothetical protein C0602_10885 [Denitrovibrio sp.]